MPRRKVTNSIEDVVIGAPRTRSDSRVFSIGLVLVGVLVIGATVVIGRSGGGPINVAATIQESNETRSASGGEQVNVVSERFQDLPNGGLVPQENQTTENLASVEEPVINNASSTATSTEEVTTESGSTNESPEPVEEATEVQAE